MFKYDKKQCHLAFVEEKIDKVFHMVKYKN